jgi:CelD/BcsL family acetyltransferase involved in cellulose biosynthesis
MQVKLIPASGLTLEHCEAWSQLQESNRNLDSPFFRPELALAMAEARDDAEIAILKQNGAAVGFFPFQRGKSNIAQSLAGRLSEFHGVVAEPGFVWDPEELIRGCGLTAWYFDHLPKTQTSFQKFAWGRSQSPYLDLSDGFDSYIAQRRDAGSSGVAQVQRKARKIAREVGPLRFEMHTADQEAWHTLLQWKTAQHGRTGVLQVFEYPWVVAMLERLRHTQTDKFSGRLSALYAGNQLVAVHFGLQASHAFHIWFPAYNPQLGKYSPGLILLLEMARTLAAMGVQRIDFGKGPERYKANFKSGDLPISEGGIDFRPALSTLRPMWHHVNQRIEASRWRQQLRTPVVATRRLRQWFAFR